MGSKQLLEQDYRESFDALCKKMMFRVGGIHNAEDIVQEAYARALRYLPTYNAERSDFAAWFSTILSRSLLDFKADERSKGTVMTSDDDLLDQEQGGDRLNNLLTSRDIASLMERRGKQEAEILALYFFGGYSPREIAQLGWGTGSGIRRLVREFKLSVRESV